MINVSLLENNIKKKLKSKGWSVDRKVDISNIIEELTQEGYEVFPLAVKILKNFIDINIEPIKNVFGKFISGDLSFKPLEVAAGELDMLEIYEPIVKEKIFPLGEVFSQFVLYVGVSGKIYMASYDEVYLIGENIEECFNNLLNKNEDNIILLEE